MSDPNAGMPRLNRSFESHTQKAKMQILRFALRMTVFQLDETLTFMPGGGPLGHGYSLVDFASCLIAGVRQAQER